jgi:hypothetical protein
VSLHLQVCACDAGNDICKTLGTCSYDICPKLTALLAVNKDKQSCGTTADCGSGFVCNTKPYQTFSCANSVVTATNHSGFCEEAAPGILSAQLDDAATSITVSCIACTLNQALLLVLLPDHLYCNRSGEIHREEHASEGSGV